MSTATLMGLETKASRRAFSRHPIDVRLDVIALRSGVPDNLPGRCTDLSEGGMGAVVAGELTAGQMVAIEFRLPHVAVPLRGRALVRHHAQLRCGFEFVGLAAEQREMIRYWARRAELEPELEAINGEKSKLANATPEARTQAADRAGNRRRRFRPGRRALFLLIAGLLMLAGLAWWHWQKSWDELEKPKRSSLDQPGATRMFPLAETAHRADLWPTRRVLGRVAS